MRASRLSHRLICALSGAFLLQLTLLGAGTLCAMGGAHANGDTAMETAMRAGVQHAMAVASSPLVSPVSAAGHACKTTTSCEDPRSPSSCTSMSACTAVVFTSSTVPEGAPVSVSVRRVPAVLSASRGPSFAPELPPPRA